MQAAGVQLTGRLLAVDGHRARFASDLAATVAAGNARMNRVLHQIDRYVDDTASPARCSTPNRSNP